MKKINDEAISQIGDGILLMRTQLYLIQDHLDNSLFHDTEKVSKCLNTIQKLVTEMKKLNKIAVVSE